MRYLLLSIFFLDVLEYAVAAVIVEVDVDIGHVDTVRVQESLEEEVILDRVYIGDLQAVSYCRSCCGTTTWAYRDALASRCCDEVLDDKEVVRESHLTDSLELEFDTLGLNVAQFIAVSPVSSLVCQMAEVCDRVAELLASLVSVLVAASLVDDSLVFFKIPVDVRHELLRKVELRKDRVLVDLVALDLLRYFEGVGKGFGMLIEHVQHLFLSLEVLLLGISHSVRLVYECVGSQADKSVVGRAVLLAYEVDVVCSDDLRAGLLGQKEDSLVGYHLVFIHLLRLSRDLCLVLLYLEVEVVSEDLLVPHDRFFRTLHVSGYDRSRNLSRDTCRTAYESFGILLHDLMADARLLVVFTLDMTGRNDLHEVLVAVVVLCQEDEVVVSSVVLVLELVVVVLGHIDLAADDRLDLGELLRHLEKLLDAIHVSMVCNGQCWHFELLCACKEVTDSRLAVKDGILCMYVKVDEGHISGF